MKFSELFEMQRELDAFIEKTQNVTKDVFEDKSLALLVELAELANETRCFKFWSTKGASEQAVILEEFVDSIHFMLSLGNMRNFALEQWPTIEQKRELTPAFIEATNAVFIFLKEQTFANYEALWNAYSVLAYNLGFTEADIVEAYQAKNAKNYERQRNGY